jgi:MOSC domain-containing protein YiiM
LAKPAGFYLSVLEEGRVAAGDSVEWITIEAHRVTVGVGKFVVNALNSLNDHF